MQVVMMGQVQNILIFFLIYALCYVLAERGVKRCLDFANCGDVIGTEMFFGQFRSFRRARDGK